MVTYLETEMKWQNVPSWVQKIIIAYAFGLLALVIGAFVFYGVEIYKGNASVPQPIAGAVITLFVLLLGQVGQFIVWYLLHVRSMLNANKLDQLSHDLHDGLQEQFAAKTAAATADKVTDILSSGGTNGDTSHPTPGS